jgi:hypothetical protein
MKCPTLPSPNTEYLGRVVKDRKGLKLMLVTNPVTDLRLIFVIVTNEDIRPPPALQ